MQLYNATPFSLARSAVLVMLTEADQGHSQLYLVSKSGDGVSTRIEGERQALVYRYVLLQFQVNIHMQMNSSSTATNKIQIQTNKYVGGNLETI